ncbi:hypothetical protein [Corynebacterium crudilactis]|uniref:hypothetical protein n=1 Tax=Corynebacterium crudilactis TaxID=1652495 RepID=UPI0012FE7365|nr:hypothetical protein [Corynebacterium crudilactis]
MTNQTAGDAPRNLQKVGAKVYRVSGGMRRSAVTGKFVVSGKSKIVAKRAGRTSK